MSNETVWLDQYDDTLLDESAGGGFDDGLDDPEFALPAIGGLLGAGGQAIGGAIGSIGQGIKRAFNYQAPQPLQIRRPSAPTGVRSATVSTPQGQTTLQLPSAVVTREEAQKLVTPLVAGLEKVAQRTTGLEQNMAKLSSRVGEALSDTRKELELSKVRNQREIARQRKEIDAKVEKLRKETGDRTNMLMMMSLLMSDNAGGDDNDALTFLPLMMMSDGGEGKGNDMNMMMMALLLTRK